MRSISSFLAPPRLARLAAPALLALAAGHAFAGKVTIADVAPKDSILVVGVDNAKALGDAFDRSGLGALWNEKSVQDWFAKASKEAMDDFAKNLESLGLTKDDIKRPAGPAGLAVWMTDGDDKNATPPPPTFMLMADYGAEAQAQHDKLMEALENAEKQKKIELSEAEHDGVKTWIITDIEDENADKLKVEDDADDADGDKHEDEYKEMHYAKVGEYLLLSSSTEGLERAIDGAQGDKLSSIEEHPDFNLSLSQLASPQGYAVLMASNLQSWLKTNIDKMDPSGEGSSTIAMLEPLGISEIKAAGMGLKLDSDDAVMEQTYAVLCPKKTGLVALFDGPAANFEPPAFVAGDAASFTTFQFNFAGVLPLLQQVIAKLPEEKQGEIGGMVTGMSATMGPILANLGPEVNMVNSYERPLGPESAKQLFAIRMKDQNALSQAIAGFAPMIGMQAKDFQGNQIWAPGDGGMIPADAFAIGMGFGHAFIGPGPIVENAMRQAGAAEGPRLSKEPAFVAASRVVKGPGLAFGYTSVKQMCEYFEWYAKNADVIARKQIEQMFGDQPPADEDEKKWREEAMADAMKSVPQWTKELPPLSLVAKHIGDGITEVRSTPEGFVGRSIWLRPAGK